MKAVVQRVSGAQVDVEGKCVASISSGLLILLGIAHSDTEAEARWLAEKIARLRIFDDDTTAVSATESHVEALVVSQFTLLASTEKGNRPSYMAAARPEHAEPLVAFFIRELGQWLGGRVKHGVFGAHMQVSLCNDGPVTIVMDTDSRRTRQSNSTLTEAPTP